MLTITESNASDYLRASGRIAAGEAIEVCELAGGVSNAVFLVNLPERNERFVLKQAREQLRVKDDWRCSLERIWREALVLSICGSLLPEPSAASPPPSLVARFQPCVPKLLWEDRPNYAYAMTAAPAGHKTWKELLLAGELPLSLGVATAAGQMLAALHAGSWQNEAIAARLDERTFFDQLRLDPYYRTIAKAHGDLAPEIARLIESVWTNRWCLVHGDYSPKNLLVWQGRVMLIDFEVGHYGDPAFDLGFFLTHLVLKGVWAGPSRRSRYLQLAATFWRTYRLALARSIAPDQLESLEARMLWNLAGCLLARVDGKSPVDYLSASQQSEVRELARAWLAAPPRQWEAAQAELVGE
ncbi:MAG: aminoglycoside phosphotransferase family protein [Pirellulaceae bacterium]